MIPFFLSITLPVALASDLVLTHDGHTELEPTTVTVTQANPGEFVFFAMGEDQGLGPCPATLGGLCLDVKNPGLLGFAVADSNGEAILVRTPPLGSGGMPRALQAYSGTFGSVGSPGYLQFGPLGNLYVTHYHPSTTPTPTVGVYDPQTGALLDTISTPGIYPDGMLIY